MFKFFRTTRDQLHQEQKLRLENQREQLLIEAQDAKMRRIREAVEGACMMALMGILAWCLVKMTRHQLSQGN